MRASVTTAAFTLGSAIAVASLFIHADSHTSVSEQDVSNVLAVSNDVAYGEYLAGECASCHATTAVSGSNVPVIHGASSEHIAQALLEYRNGIRENSTMKNVASALGDEEIAALAHFLAQQTK
ncbi:MAG: cytochrome c [Granulosicoccus sp.]